MTKGKSGRSACYTPFSNIFLHNIIALFANIITRISDKILINIIETIIGSNEQGEPEENKDIDLIT
jgi:hypothetical protein